MWLIKNKIKQKTKGKKKKWTELVPEQSNISESALYLNRTGI